MISNKSDLAHERRRPRGVIGTILSAAALSAILGAAPPAPTQQLELMIAGPEGGPSSDMQRYEG